MRHLAWLSVLLVMAGSSGLASEPVPPIVEQIRQEAVKKDTDPSGRPLPLASHWNRRDFATGTWQIDLIRQGRHIMPWLEFPRYGPMKPEQFEKEYEAFRILAAWKLPFTLVGTQWNALLYDHQGPPENPGRWRYLPPEKSPLTWDIAPPDPKKPTRKELSPFGAIEPWREVGAYWVNTPTMHKLQEIYPDPPRVIFLSNNEPSELDVPEVLVSRRFVEKYGKDADAQTIRKAMAEGWIERYRAMLGAMRQALDRPAWRQNSVFAGYGAFGPPHFGRWSAWNEKEMEIPGRISPWPLAWEGGSPSYYTHNWNASSDYRVWSPQVESMNWVFMLDEAYRDNPSFWFEVSAWDGNRGKADDKAEFYRKQGQTWSAQRYEGFLQYGLWLLRPRVLREFRGSTEKRQDKLAEFEAALRAVDNVWSSPVLVRFWRKGELVLNPAHEHPYQSAIPEWYRAVKRWYLFDTNLDPQRPWKLETELPVFSLARVLGEQGNREWLVYAHSPVTARAGVRIMIPGYQSITVDVPVEGAFYHVTEQGGKLTRLK